MIQSESGLIEEDTRQKYSVNLMIIHVKKKKTQFEGI